VKSIRVLLVDDHPVVLSGVRGLLEQAADIKIIGEARTGEEALRLVDENPPDVLLLDMALPDIPGPQVAERVKKLHPEVRILSLSAHEDPVFVRELLKLGAAGYLLKEEAPEVILKAVRGVASGQQGWVSRSIAAQIAAWARPDGPNVGQLTGREQETLRLVVQGKTNQAIALEMSISEKTVEKYVSAIFTKLNVSSRVEAAVTAVREGLTED
jgi:two-component system, NarL family, response regulator